MTTYMPCLPWNRYKIDTVFADKYYLKRYGAYHPGWDVNGVGGGDTDYDLPIFSIGDGKVTNVAKGSNKWGLIVRVFHPQFNIFSRYAHLKDATVKVGQSIEGGSILGHMGNAGGFWVTHLHIDLMVNIPGLPFDYWRNGTSQEDFKDLLRTYVDPAKFFNKFPPKKTV